MRRKVYSWMLLLGAVALPGCGSVQEMILDELRASAKESIEQAVDEAVDQLVDEALDQALDLGGLTADDEQPNE